MKFLILLFVITTQAWAQGVMDFSPSNSTNVSQTEMSTFSLEKIKAKFKINYFSETLGPSIKKWQDNEIEDDGSIKREPMTTYHSFNVRYLLGEKFNLFMSPRFNTVIGDRNDIRSDADPHVFVVDDWQFGFLYTFYARPWINYSQAITHRAPFSAKSRGENINSQVEWNHFVTWAISPSWRLLSWNNYRWYAYNDESPTERYRINWRNIFIYTMNDKWGMQFSYELDLQHRNGKYSDDPGHRGMNFMKRYHSYTSVGVSYSPVRNFSIIPFIRTVDERNIRNETTIVGLTLLGKVL